LDGAGHGRAIPPVVVRNQSEGVYLTYREGKPGFSPLLGVKKSYDGTPATPGWLSLSW
jgi:hypothetical protein